MEILKIIILNQENQETTSWLLRNCNFFVTTFFLMQRVGYSPGTA